MEDVMKKSFIVAIFFAIFLGGCAGTNPSTEWNAMLIKQKAPVRMVKDNSLGKKGTTRYVEDWAGVKGKSGINERYKNIIFSNIKKKCGFTKEDFREVYIVQHAEDSVGMIIEEVWLFNDQKSFREDKISGLTVYLEYNKKSNLTSGDIFGNCHTSRGTSFIVTN